MWWWSLAVSSVWPTMRRDLADWGTGKVRVDSRDELSALCRNPFAWEVLRCAEYAAGT